MPTTCRTFSGIILLAQCFGLLPMVNVRAKDANLLKFKMKSFRFVHSAIITILLTFNLLFYIAQVAHVGLTFNKTVTTLFFAFGPVSALLLLRLATKWPNIMRQWSDVDVKMADYGFPPNLKRNLYLTAIIVIGAASVEHSFFLTFALSNAPEVMHSSSPWEGLNAYLASSGSHVFEYVPYNPFFGFVFKLIDITITFVWNYVDMLIMTIAVAISARFRQVNNRIIDIVNYLNSEEKALENVKFDVNKEGAEALEANQDGGMFYEIREDYNHLCQLTAAVDAAIAQIIVLSFANNLFLILVQLLHSIEPQEKTRAADRLYFAYSFGFLILRTSAVALTSSQIYVESRRPAWYLTTQLPEEHYDDEVERLLMQIRATGGCFLTGDGFFKISSSLILSIAGAIVSYELIFIQFNLPA